MLDNEKAQDLMISNAELQERLHQKQVRLEEKSAKLDAMERTHVPRDHHKAIEKMSG